MPKQTRTTVSDYLNELCDYGGIAATRGEIYRHVYSVYKSKGAPDKSAHRCGDMACASDRYKQINDPSETATGLTLKQAEEQDII